MATAAGLGIITDGLIAVIDPNNRKTNIDATSTTFINTDGWASGQTGSVGSYDQNGNTGENVRVNDTDPWGDSSCVWETRASGDGNADGGWNNGYYNIDKTKLYRFSVWMRRTSSTAGGTFYFGLYGSGGTWGVKIYNGNTEGNPYWQCVGTGAYTQNQWYLHVGHCYPAGTSISGWHKDSGIYLPNNPTKWGDMGGCNVGYDPAWLNDATVGLHRTYHYYCGDSTTRLQFAYPRFDVCDGTQPSISELVSARSKQLKNLINSTQYNFTTSAQGGANINTSTASGLLAKVFNLDGTSALYSLVSGLNLAGSSYTIIGASRYKGGTSGRIITAVNNNWLMGHWAGYTENYYAEGWVSNVGAGAGDANWRIYAATWNSSTDSASLYVNGVLAAGPNSSASAGPNQISFGGVGSEPSNGEAGALYIYNRVLSADEVLQCYHALRPRYNL